MMFLHAGLCRRVLTRLPLSCLHPFFLSECVAAMTNMHYSRLSHKQHLFTLLHLSNSLPCFISHYSRSLHSSSTFYSPSFSIFFWYKISGSASFIHGWLSLLSCCSSSGSCCKRLSYLKMVLLLIITSECKCVNAGALRSTKPRADTAFSIRTAMKEVLQGKTT